MLPIHFKGKYGIERGKAVPEHGWEVRNDALDVFAFYEDFLKEREGEIARKNERIAELEAELASLRPQFEVGEMVEWFRNDGRDAMTGKVMEVRTVFDIEFGDVLTHHGIDSSSIRKPILSEMDARIARAKAEGGGMKTKLKTEYMMGPNGGGWQVYAPGRILGFITGPEYPKPFEFMARYPQDVANADADALAATIRKGQERKKGGSNA